LVQHSISDEVEAIHEMIRVARAKFKPLLDSEIYLEDVSQLAEVVPRMLDNIEALAKELNHAFTILSNTPKKD
jgi:DNA anti-recombination protein RmuC